MTNTNTDKALINSYTPLFKTICLITLIVFTCSNNNETEKSYRLSLGEPKFPFTLQVINLEDQEPVAPASGEIRIIIRIVNLSDSLLSNPILLELSMSSVCKNKNGAFIPFENLTGNMLNPSVWAPNDTTVISQSLQYLIVDGIYVSPSFPLSSSGSFTDGEFKLYNRIDCFYRTLFHNYKIPKFKPIDLSKKFHGTFSTTVLRKDRNDD